ncbi:MAG: prolipoprotein diacylglyceryl transferase [Bacillota bacterium]|nr:prolipoprotein diacylglyceryl transferase [Bacillota bacterium]
MHPVLFQLGGLRVYSYGFFVALGLLAAVWWLAKKVAKEGRSPQIVIDLALLVLIAGVIGARLAFILLYDPGFYLSHPWHIFMLQEGGLAFYGALVFGLATAFFYLRIARLSVLSFFDLASPALALGYAIARIGCFLNGCCYGKPTELPWGVVFTAVDDLPRHPTQLYSLLAGLSIFMILEFFIPRARFRGQIFSLLLILYGLSRALIELFRENAQLPGGAGIAALAALILAAAGGLLYFYLARRPGTSVSPSLSIDGK